MSNTFLNIGPTGDGSIPAESVTCMTAVGKWMDVNAEAIRGTTVADAGKLEFDGRLTRKGNTHYLHLFSRPGDGTVRVAVKASKATLLAGAKPLEVKSADGLTTITLPQELPDPAATVIRLE